MNNYFKSKNKFPIYKVVENHISSTLDSIVTEEPLEIRIVDPFSGTKKTLAITMRTPGDDFDLAVGFLYNEGIIKDKSDIQTLSYCLNSHLEEKQKYNIINIQLQEHIKLNLPSLERHFFTSSSCGICGKASLEALKLKGCSPINTEFQISIAMIYKLSEQLNKHQKIFTKTGGLHATALFDLEGNLIKIREDIGRHNAVDKLIGSELLANNLPLNNKIIMVSGRTSFEILQKCIMAKIPLICSVSAPSSLAVLLAQEFNLTLIGFLRENRFNIYAGKNRIKF